MQKQPALITYRTKIKEFTDGTKYIDYKKSISRIDCNLKPYQHTYYNCDMFPSMLKKATLEAQANKEWSRISELPDCISIDDSGFLAAVTITINI